MIDLDTWWPDVLDQHEAEIMRAIAEDEAMRNGETPNVKPEGES